MSCNFRTVFNNKLNLSKVAQIKQGGIMFFRFGEMKNKGEEILSQKMFFQLFGDNAEQKQMKKYVLL